MGWRLRGGGEERLPSYAALVTWARERERSSRRRRGCSCEPLPQRPGPRGWHSGARERCVKPSSRSAARWVSTRAKRCGRGRRSCRTPERLAQRPPVVERRPLRRDMGRAPRESRPPVVARRRRRGGAARVETNCAASRMCAGAGCGWLFLDQSRNSSRRWCASGDCGNRARVDHFRLRQRRAGQG